MRDKEEMFPELARHVFIGVVLPRELHRDGEHVEAVHRHPAGAVRLFKVSTRWQRGGSIEHPDIVEPQEAALEHVPASFVLAIDPPSEVEQQFLKDALQKDAIALARAPLVDLVDTPRRPGVHRRIDVAESPLVRRELPVSCPLVSHPSIRRTHVGMKRGTVSRGTGPEVGCSLVRQARSFV